MEKNQIKKLHLGRMKTAQIASWMGISYSTFRNVNKKQRLKQLSQFCQFKEVYGGVDIIEIYQEEYTSKIPDDKVVFLNEIKNANDNLSTVAGMVRKLRNEDEYYKSRSEDQVKKKLTKANKALFGYYDKDNKIQSINGSIGNRKYVFGIQLDQFNRYRKLTPEEDELLNHIINSICGSEAIKNRERMLLEKEFEETDMSKEDYIALKNRFNLDLFSDVFRQFKFETGFILRRVQEYEIVKEEVS